MRGLTVKSSVSVPLMRGGMPIGALVLGSRERGGFSDSQIDLLKTFAEQAVIAITSAETYRELQQRTGDLQEALEQQTATAEVLQVINASPGDLAPVFDAILEKAHTLCGAALGSLVFYDGEHFNVQAAHGYPGDYAALIRMPFKAPPNSPFERLLHGEPLVHVIDAAEVAVK
jgi:two-component system, NtrC family, sensor kinase